MITQYPTAKEFLKDNGPFLDQNPYMSAFFYADEPLLRETNRNNYAFRSDVDGHRLLTMKVARYNLMFYGDSECMADTLSYLKERDFFLGEVLCETKVGQRLVELAPSLLGVTYRLHVGMDFMETKQKTEETSLEVERANENDVDELVVLLERFVHDCGLNDRFLKEEIERAIDTFRVIRIDGQIVSLAHYAPETENSERVSAVYTRPEYRGQGYARKVVNAIKNEILERGYTATLYVDQANPISNRLYASLGFKKVFSRGIYRPE